MTMPLHLKLKISRTICYFFSEAGRRIVRSEERRIRRKARRLGLVAWKDRSEPGGWTVDVDSDGTIVRGPGLTSTQVEEFLDGEIAKRAAA